MMKVLIFRICCLSVTIGTMLVHIIQKTNSSITTTLFIMSGILCFYFLLPLTKKPFYSYLAILLLITLYSFASIQLVYVLPLFAFIMVEATLQLKDRTFYLLFSLSIGVIATFTLLHYIPFYDMLLMISIILCCFMLNHYVKEVGRKEKVFEQLLTQYRQLKRMSVEQEQFVRAEERTKIARDIHDLVGHKLTSLLMQLEMMSIQNSTDSIQEAKQLARDSLEETRFAVRQLKSFETSGIQSVIQLIRKLEMESRIYIRFTLEKGVLSLPISNQQSVVLYRVLQECLTNAMKHSSSKEVEVILKVNSLQHIQFEVKNKFISSLPFMKGFGLINMEERLKEIGGELRMVRTDEHFIVSGSFPFNLSKEEVKLEEKGV